MVQPGPKPELASVASYMRKTLEVEDGRWMPMLLAYGIHQKGKWVVFCLSHGAGTGSGSRKETLDHFKSRGLKLPQAAHI